MMFALGGILMPSASSTARQEATAWTTVQTPQIRWVKAQASRGSRPSMMISMPRNWVEDAQESVIFPFSACTSIRRCPSIRVMGSTTTLVAAMVCPFPYAFGVPVPLPPVGGSTTGSWRLRSRI